MLKLSERLFQPADPRRLAGLRVGLGALIAWRLAIQPFSDFADYPSELYRPLSFMHLFNSMPSKTVITTVQVLGICAALLVVLGVKARISLPVAWVSLLYLCGLVTSTGKIMHNDVVLLITVIPLLPACTDAAWALLPSGRKRSAKVQPSALYGWPVRVAMISVAFAYLFAGYGKLAASGLGWVTSENLRYVLYSASDGQANPNHLALFIADHSWLYHAFAASTIFFELGFILALFVKKLRWLFVPGAVALHAGIWLTMRIDYSCQAAVVVAVFANWPWLIDRVRARELVGAQVVDTTPKI